MYYNPYQGLSGGRWQKCNFHCHTEQLIDWDTLQITDKGFENLARNYKSACFDAVANSHKSKWIDYSELARELNMSIFRAQEHVVEYDGVVLVNAKQFYNCPPQQAIDSCIKDGGFCYIAHPNQNPALKFPGIPGGYPHEVIDSLSGVTGIEIYNGCLPNRAYIDIPFGDGLSTDIWDEQLSKGKKYWGFGSDDAHEAYEINTCWTEIYAKSNQFEDIYEAVQRGSFCVSRGLRLYRFELDNDLLQIEVDHTYMRTHNMTYRFIGEHGKILAVIRGASAEYSLIGEKYVRVEAIADDGAMIWTQPVLNLDFFQISVIEDINN